MRTPVCDVLGIDAPVMQGSIGPWTNAEPPAAVSEAGGLGSIGTALKSAEQVADLIDRVRELTDRPFAVNFTARPFAEEPFAATLARKPAVISMRSATPAISSSGRRGRGGATAPRADAGGLARQLEHGLAEDRRVPVDVRLGRRR